MTLPLQVTVSLAEMNCGKCGGTYAINERYRRKKEEIGGYWTCPYCKCSWGYGESALKVKEEELAAEKQRHQQTLARLNEAAAQAEKVQKQFEKAKKETLTLKTRVNAGVCTCCNRTFQNLARHMATKHKQAK